jgi:DNA-binding response OmpR family regulator
MNQNTTVLVVDDDPNIRDVLATALRDEGYRVDTASDGAEALQLARKHEPGAVILDVMMPVMDGWEFLEQWRSRPADHRAPVLVVSAGRDWTTALDLGATGYLSKPFDLLTLETTLASVL